MWSIGRQSSNKVQGYLLEWKHIVWCGDAVQWCVLAMRDCNALAGVKARHWRLGSQSAVGRVTCDWQHRGGRAPYSAVLLYTSTTDDTRWSSKLARSIVTEVRRSAQRRRRVSGEASSTTYPSLQRSKVGESLVVTRESPLDKCLRESLSGRDRGLWVTPNQTTDGDQD